MESKSADTAVACFKNGFSCAQAVFSTYAERLGLNQESALKVSGAFGGGMAGTASTCGAVTGGLMVIGLKYGKSKPDDDSAKEKTQARAKVFMEKFRDKHGSLVCKELVGCDISTVVGKRVFDETNCKERLCVGFVGDAVTILDEIL
jgi:C_GCAxxG_C_C family probable redox protein